MGALLRHLLLPALAFGCSSPSLPIAPPPAAEESGRYVQDVEYALAAFERLHPRIYWNSTRREFLDEIDRLKQRGRDLTRDEAFLGLMRLVALADDAHTRMHSWDEIEETELPITLESWSDGIWITAVQPDEPKLFARHVVAIEKVPIVIATGRLAPWIPHENDAQLRAGAARAASNPQLLRASGLLGDSDRVRFRLVDAEGKQEDVEVRARPRADIVAPVFFAPGETWTPPLHRERRLEDWWWKTIDDGRTIYLQYNRCVSRQDHPFEETVSECLALIDDDPKVERLFVDLRNNGGGDSRVLRPLIQGLRMRTARMPGSRIGVGIGPGTFSSGMINAWQMKRDLGAVLIGEPTLQKPDSFGEVRSITLPNTGWIVDCSTQRFRPFGDNRPSLQPDVRVLFGFASVLEGRDPVVDWFSAQMGSSLAGARQP